MHIVSNIALISINETLIIQLVSFLIFLFLINRIMFRPLSHVMVERENHLTRFPHISKNQKPSLRKSMNRSVFRK